MAFSKKVGSLSAKTGSTGSQGYTGVGFQPKASIFFNSRQTATGDVAGAGINVGISGTGAQDILGGANSADNVTTSDTVRSIRNDRIYESLPYGNATADSAASLTSNNSDGWTFNFSAVGSAYKIPYLALGGSDITNAYAGMFTLSTSTGQQSFTGVGFQPDLVIFIFQGYGTSSGDANSNVCFGMGAATDSSHQWASAIGMDHAVGTSNTRRIFDSTKCIFVQAVGGGTNGKASFVSMDTDGFTIDNSTAFDAAYVFGALCIKGGQWHVGNDTQKTSTGTKSTTGVGFQPEVLLIASSGSNTDGTQSTTAARFSLGVTDGTNTESTWLGDEDNAAVTIANSSYSTSKILMYKDEATSASPTTDAEAGLSSLDSDGFTLNWTTADATARIFGYVAGAGSEVAILGNDTALSTSIDATTITQNHVVADTDVALSTTIDTTTITQNHVIATNDIALSLTEDATTIAQNHSVTGQDIALALTADNTTITQVHTVATQDLATALTVDAGTISQDHQFSPADIAISTSEDNTTVEESGLVILPDDVAAALIEDATTISQTHSITVQDVALAPTEDATTITQVHVLSPSDVAISLTMDNTTTVYNQIFSPADVSLALAEDSSMITQNHNFAPADITISLTIDATTVVEETVNIAAQNIALALTEAATTIMQNYSIAPADILIALASDQALISILRLFVDIEGSVPSVAIPGRLPSQSISGRRQAVTTLEGSPAAAIQISGSTPSINI